MLLKNTCLVLRNIGLYSDKDILRLKLILDFTNFDLYIFTAQDIDNIELFFMNLSTHPKTVNCNLVGCFKSFSTPNKVSTLNNGILRTPSGKGSSSKRNENSPYHLRSSEKKKN